MLHVYTRRLVMGIGIVLLLLTALFSVVRNL